MLRNITNSTHIDCVDMYGRTPLMLAVTPGYNEVAQLLVDHGPQVDCTDKNLRTALHRAVSTNTLGLMGFTPTVQSMGQDWQRVLDMGSQSMQK